MISLLSPLQPFRQRLSTATPEYERLCRLPRRTRQVLLLSRLDEWTYADIAARLDLSLAEVERDMVRALTQTWRHAAPQEVVGEACRWYVRLQSPQTTASDRIEFRRWLDTTPSHLQAFHATELHWRGLHPAAERLGARMNYHRRHRPVERGAWIAGVVSMAVLMLLAF